MRKPGGLKVVSTIMVLAYFATQCALAHAVETSFWEQRRKRAGSAKASASPLALARSPLAAAEASPVTALPSVQPLTSTLSDSIKTRVPADVLKRQSALLNALPYAYGQVRDISLPQGRSSGQVVIHIEDVHMNPEAQANIGRAVQGLIAQKKIDLLALEGAFGPMDLRLLRDCPWPQDLRMAADYMLRENKISGALHTALTSPAPVPPLVGVDDRARYDANVEAYRRSITLAKERKESLSQARTDLRAKKQKTFAPALLSFDRQVEAYREGRLPFAAYLQFLARHRSPGSENMKNFLAALEMESRLDFGEVEKDRARLLEALTGALKKGDIDDLLKQSVAYRLGHLAYADFYKYLQDLCRKNAVDLSRYPAMKTYIGYVLLSQKIDAHRLYEETQQLEEAGYAALLQNSQETALLKESKRLHLTGKLLDFALTPDEWRDYRRLSPSGTGLPPFEDFYRQADARDDAMASNLQKAMKAHKAQVAVMVTGGFHSPGVASRLTRAGATVITFTPKITKVDTAGGAAYLSVFTQEKSPLQKLFEGEKLFLSPEQLNMATNGGALVAPVIALGESEAHERYRHFFNSAARVSATRVRETIRLVIPPVVLLVTLADGRIQSVVEEGKRDPLLLGAKISGLAAGFGALLYAQLQWHVWAVPVIAWIFPEIVPMAFWTMTIGAVVALAALTVRWARDDRERFGRGFESLARAAFPVFAAMGPPSDLQILESGGTGSGGMDEPSNPTLGGGAPEPVRLLPGLAPTDPDVIVRRILNQPVRVKGRLPDPDFNFHHHMLQLWAATPHTESPEQAVELIADLFAGLRGVAPNPRIDEIVADLRRRPTAENRLRYEEFDVAPIQKLIRLLFPFLEGREHLLMDESRVFPFSWKHLQEERVLFSLGHVDTRVKILLQDIAAEGLIPLAQVPFLAEQAHAMLTYFLKTQDHVMVRYVNNLLMVYLQDRAIRLLVGAEIYEAYKRRVMVPDLRTKNDAALEQLKKIAPPGVESGMETDRMLALQILAGVCFPQDRSGEAFRASPQFDALVNGKPVGDYLGINHLPELIGDIAREVDAGRRPHVIFLIDDVGEGVFDLRFFIQPLLELFPTLTISAWVNRAPVENNFYTGELNRLLGDPYFQKLSEFRRRGRLRVETYEENMSLAPTHTPLLCLDPRFMTAEAMRKFRGATAVILKGTASFETTQFPTDGVNAYYGTTVYHPATQEVTGMDIGKAIFVHVPPGEVAYRYLPDQKRFETTVELDEKRKRGLSSGRLILPDSNAGNRPGDGPMSIKAGTEVEEILLFPTEESADLAFQTGYWASLLPMGLALVYALIGVDFNSYPALITELILFISGIAWFGRKIAVEDFIARHPAWRRVGRGPPLAHLFATAGTMAVTLSLLNLSALTFPLLLVTGTLAYFAFHLAFHIHWNATHPRQQRMAIDGTDGSSGDQPPTPEEGAALPDLERDDPMRTQWTNPAVFDFFESVRHDVRPAVAAIVRDVFGQHVGPGRVLELGSGQGEMAGLLPGPLRDQLVETEWEPAFLTRNPHSLPKVVANLLRLPFADGAWPAVASFSVLDTIVDLGMAAREIHRVLAPGGVMVGFLDLGPNDNALMARYPDDVFLPAAVPIPWVQDSRTIPHGLLRVNRGTLARFLDLNRGVLPPEFHVYLSGFLTDQVGGHLNFQSQETPHRRAVAEYIQATMDDFGVAYEIIEPLYFFKDSLDAALHQAGLEIEVSEFRTATGLMELNALRGLPPGANVLQSHVGTSWPEWDPTVPAGLAKIFATIFIVVAKKAATDSGPGDAGAETSQAPAALTQDDAGAQGPAAAASGELLRRLTERWREERQSWERGQTVSLGARTYVLDGSGFGEWKTRDGAILTERNVDSFVRREYNGREHLYTRATDEPVQGLFVYTPVEGAAAEEWLRAKRNPPAAWVSGDIARIAGEDLMVHQSGGRWLASQFMEGGRSATATYLVLFGDRGEPVVYHDDHLGALNFTRERYDPALDVTLYSYASLHEAPVPPVVFRNTKDPRRILTAAQTEGVDWDDIPVIADLSGDRSVTGSPEWAARRNFHGFPFFGSADDFVFAVFPPEPLRGHFHHLENSDEWRIHEDIPLTFRHMLLLRHPTEADILATYAPSSRDAALALLQQHGRRGENPEQEQQAWERTVLARIVAGDREREARASANYLFAYLAPQDALPLRADVALVFGNEDLRVVEGAAALYHQGRILKKIVVSGGSGRLTAPLREAAVRAGHLSAEAAAGLTEGEILKEILRAYQVPEDFILVENEAKHTYGNAVLSLKKLDEEGVAFSSIIALQTPLQEKRSAEVLREALREAQRPDVTVYSYAADVPRVEEMTPEARDAAERAALAEIDRFIDYGKPGPLHSLRTPPELEGLTTPVMRHDFSGAEPSPLFTAIRTVRDRVRRADAIAFLNRHRIEVGLHTVTGSKSLAGVATETLVEFSRILIARDFMPALDNLDALRRLRDDPATRDAVLAFLTEDNRDLARQAAAAGASLILAGPGLTEDDVRSLKGAFPHVLVFGDAATVGATLLDDVRRVAAAGADGVMIKPYFNREGEAQVEEEILNQIRAEHPDLIIVLAGGVFEGRVEGVLSLAAKPVAAVGFNAQTLEDFEAQADRYAGKVKPLLGAAADGANRPRDITLQTSAGILTMGLGMGLLSMGWGTTGILGVVMIVAGAALLLWGVEQETHWGRTAARFLRRGKARDRVLAATEPFAQLSKDLPETFPPSLGIPAIIDRFADTAPGFERRKLSDIADRWGERGLMLYISDTLSMFDLRALPAYLNEGEADIYVRRVFGFPLIGHHARYLGSGYRKRAFLLPELNMVARVYFSYGLGRVERRTQFTKTEAVISRAVGNDRIAARVVDFPGQPMDLVEVAVPFEMARSRWRRNMPLGQALLEAKSANLLTRNQLDKNAGLVLRREPGGNVNAYVVLFDLEGTLSHPDSRRLIGEIRPRPIPYEEVKELFEAFARSRGLPDPLSALENAEAMERLAAWRAHRILLAAVPGKGAPAAAVRQWLRWLDADPSGYYERLQYAFGADPRLHDRLAIGSLSAGAYADILALLFRHADISPETRVLEIGSAAGTFLDVLRRLGAVATGLEPNEALAGHAARAGLSSLQGDLFAVPEEITEGIKYDVTVGRLVLDVMHAADGRSPTRLGEYAALRRLSLATRYGGLTVQEVSPDLDFPFTPDDWKKAGFDPVEAPAPHLAVFRKARAPETLESFAKSLPFAGEDASRPGNGRLMALLLSYQFSHAPARGDKLLQALAGWVEEEEGLRELSPGRLAHWIANNRPLRNYFLRVYPGEEDVLDRHARSHDALIRAFGRRASAGPNSLLYLLARHWGWPHPERWGLLGMVLEMAFFSGLSYASFLFLGDYTLFYLDFFRVNGAPVPVLLVAVLYSIPHTYLDMIEAHRARGQPVNGVWIVGNYFQHLFNFLPYVLAAVLPPLRLDGALAWLLAVFYHLIYDVRQMRLLRGPAALSLFAVTVALFLFMCGFFGLIINAIMEDSALRQAGARVQDVREIAASTRPDRTERLIHFLRSDPHRMVRDNAANELANLKDPVAVDALLLSSVGDADFLVRKSAAYALIAFDLDLVLQRADVLRIVPPRVNVLPAARGARTKVAIVVLDGFGEGEEHGKNVAAVTEELLGENTSIPIYRVSVDPTTLGPLVLKTGMDEVEKLVRDHPDTLFIVNVSHATVFYDTITLPLEKVKQLGAVGTVFVVAAGNENQLAWNFPERLDNVVEVAALDERTGHKASYSGYGWGVDFAAIPRRKSGTSFAAPVVTTGLALRLAANPNLAAADALARAEKDATPLAPGDPYFERGLLGDGQWPDETVQDVPAPNMPTGQGPPPAGLTGNDVSRSTMLQSSGGLMFLGIAAIAAGGVLPGVLMTVAGFALLSVPADGYARSLGSVGVQIKKAMSHWRAKAVRKQARSDARKAAALARGKGNMTTADLRSLLLPRQEFLGLGAVVGARSLETATLRLAADVAGRLRDDALYREEFTLAYQEALSAPPGDKPSALDIFWSLHRAAVGSQAPAEETGPSPSVQVIDWIVSRQDLPSVAAMIQELEGVNQTQPQPAWLRLIPGEAGMIDDLRALAARGVHVRVRPVAVDAGALEEDFEQWRKREPGVRGKTLRLAVSVSAGIDVAGQPSGDSIYDRALRAALAVPARPVDFLNMLELAAALATFA